MLSEAKTISLLELFASRIRSKHQRHSGIMGLTSTAAGVRADLYFDLIIPLLLECSNDSDETIADCANEALYNTVKAYRVKTQRFFSQIFDELCTSLVHPDAEMSNRANNLDLLMRDVAAEAPLDVAALADALRLNAVGDTLE